MRKIQLINIVAVSLFGTLAHASPVSNLGGTVFRELPLNGAVSNTYGVQDTNELGVSGVDVTVTGENGTVVTVQTNTAGSWTASGAFGNDARVEVTGIPTYLQSSEFGTDSGTTVQFVTDDQAAINVGLHNASQYCQANPKAITPVYVNGDPAANGLSESVYAYDYSGANKTTIASKTETGATWGVAYDSKRNTLYTSSVLRRHVGIGPSGGSAIYAIADPKGTPGTATLLHDLTTATGVPTNTARSLIGVDPTDLNHDDPAFPLVAKVGLGDIDISEDGDTLFVTNLTDKFIYSVDLNNPAAAAALLPAFPTTTCNNGEARPWALKVHDAKLYLGVVCSAEGASGTAADLGAYVYAFDGTSWTTAINNYSLDYPRQLAAPLNNAAWRPWRDTVADFSPPNNSAFTRATPILSDIEFDDSGNMILGFIDRTSMQYGALNWGTGTNESIRYQVASGGDILRAVTNNDGTFTVETITAATDEFYDSDLKVSSAHQETAQGGLAVLSGTNEVVSTGMDPISFNTGGIYWFNNSSGTTNNRFELFSGRNPDTGFMGKGAGLGDVELLCDPAPIQIGNFVWVDTDNDGIQDPDESPIAGVTVYLYEGATLVSTATTSATGEYYFGGAANINMNGGALKTETNYQLRIDLVDPTLGGKAPTTQDAGTDIHDSDGDDGILNTGFSTIAYTTGNAGENDHTLDFGFVQTPVTVKIGNLVWIEDDNDGDSTTGTITPVVGTTVTATASDGTTTYTGTTDVNGNYLIDVPANDTYTVTVATPSGVVPTAGSTDSDVGTDTSGENNKTHNGAGTTVTVETTDNLTLDFGFTPPTTPLVKIGNLVWIEDDNDGDSTTGNITPVVGTTVTATASDGTTTYTGTTDTNGNYLIDVPANDTYTVTVATPSGVVPTAGSTDSDVGTDTSGENNKTHNGAGTTVTVETTDNLTLDFGFTPPTTPLVKIGNLVWIEDDNDGDSTTGNITPVVGTTVTATASDGTTTYTGTTDTNGNYLIDVPANDTYTVTVATPSGVVPTAGSTDSDVGTDTSGENNKTHNGAGTTVTVETTDNLTLDFGFVSVPTVKIGDLVWIEDDNDGDSTTGNITPVAGVVVTATASDGTIYTDTTDASGNYLIDVPENDTYTVTVATPTGNVPTLGSNDNSVPDATSENNKTHDGLGGTSVVVVTEDNLTLDFGFTPSVKIGSLIWYEDDNDGDATTGTVTYPPAGVVVTARAADGSIYTGVTGANGSYSIDVPINGTYTVTIPPPSGYSPTSGSGDSGVPGDNSEDNQSHNGSGTTVTVGTTDNLTVDFGFINNSLLPPPSNEPIPTLSEWALMLLMMMLGFIGYRQGLVRKKS